MKIFDFLNKKQSKIKITVVTCYDYTSAQIVNSSSIDAILVGDSLAMVMHGNSTTLAATESLMALHTAAVAKGAPDKFIIGDLPFLSYRKDLSSNVTAAGELMRAGAHSVKLEGARGNLDLISHLVDSGIPVMGHLGLTPQSINQLGGFKVQGRTNKEQDQLFSDSLALEKSGCFSLVLECVPSKLAHKISQELKIPTIGIGAGPDTDGQVLVWQDLLGMNPKFNPKFLKKYMQGFELMQSALNSYHSEVTAGQFPTFKESYE